MPTKKTEAEIVEVKKVETKVVAEKEPESLVNQFITELAQHPERAVNLVQVLSKITKPWEAIGMDGAAAGPNEVPVPPGKSAQAYQRQNVAGPNISAFRLTTIFGDDVALIVKDSPKWRITIEGEPQIDGPFVEHGQKAEIKAKTFVEERLRLRGFIIGK